MHAEDVRAYCLAKDYVAESLPFGPDVLVFKVMDKIFCLFSLFTIPLRINLKCDPAYALELRDQYTSIEPGFHMNKQHWNTIFVEDGDVSDALIYKLIDDSYDLVLAKVPKKTRLAWENS